jgi:chromatin remodeling complex protein RSC6
MPHKKKSTVGKSSSKRSASKKSAGPNSAVQSGKKRTGRPVAAYMKRTSSAPASGSQAGKTVSRSKVTGKLWAYIKKNGLADRQTRRPIFNSTVQLRNLAAADITRMLSGAEIKLS